MADQVDYASLIKSWGELRDSAIWASVIISIVIAVCFIVYYVMQYKKTKSSQDAKNSRANKIVSSHAQVSSSLALVKDELTNLTIMMKDLPSVKDLKSNIDLLTQKVSGITDAHDSLNLIRLVFFKAVYYEIRDSLNEWLNTKESDFKSREQFIANSIRTDMGEILNRYRSTLSDFKLSVNHNMFFKLSSSESVERYILVDIIWSEIKDYFVSPLKYEQRVEECSLKLFNIIKDYVNTIIIEMKDDNIPEKKNEMKTVDNRVFRTPLPFKLPES